MSFQKFIKWLKKHQKPNPNKGVAGGIVQIELPIHRSNIAIYNKSKKTKDKVIIQKDKDGNKTRLYRSSNKKI